MWGLVPKSSSESNHGIMPFVIAAQGDAQDRVIIGPDFIKADQQNFLQWIYRDMKAGERSSAFRLGKFGGYAVAARLYPVQLKEEISARTDAMIVVGLICRNATPGSLNECLGVVALPMAERVLTDSYPEPGRQESETFPRLAQHIAAADFSHDWSTADFVTRRICHGVPIHLLTARSRIRKLIGEKRCIGALLDGAAPVSLKYQIASEIWVRHERSDLTIMLEHDPPQRRGKMLFFESSLVGAVPLVVVAVTEIAFTGQPIGLLTLD